LSQIIKSARYWNTIAIVANTRFRNYFGLKIKIFCYYGVLIISTMYFI